MQLKDLKFVSCGTYMLENPGQAFVLLLLPVFLSPAQWPFQLDVKPNIKISAIFF